MRDSISFIQPIEAYSLTLTAIMRFTVAPLLLIPAALANIGVRYYYDSHCSYYTGAQFAPSLDSLCYGYSWGGTKFASISFCQDDDNSCHCKFYTDGNCNTEVPYQGMAAVDTNFISPPWSNKLCEVPNSRNPINALRPKLAGPCGITVNLRLDVRSAGNMLIRRGGR